MKKKKTKSLIISGIMTMAMMAMPISASAAPLDAANPQVEKILHVEQGITVPDLTFAFTATKVTTDAPDLTISNIEMNNETGTTLYGDILNSEGEKLTGVTDDIIQVTGRAAPSDFQSEEPRQVKKPVPLSIQKEPEVVDGPLNIL